MLAFNCTSLLPLLLELLLYFGFSCSDVDRPVMATCLTLMSSVRRIRDTYLAAPKGFDLEPALEGLGEAWACSREPLQLGLLCADTDILLI